MTSLYEIPGATPRGEMDGISLGQNAAWEVSPTSDFPSFLRALPSLLPPDSFLYLEGKTPPKQIRAFLRLHCVPEVSHIAMGTIWPKPQTYHFPATTENLEELAEIAKMMVAPKEIYHLHAYAHGSVLLEWHDALWKDPLYLSSAIPENKVKDFCSALSLTYKRHEQKH